jgi:DNA polymerase III alpha subunit
MTARVRTGYSFRAAAGALPEVMARLKACGYPAAPITDRASTFGWVRWNALCEKEGMKPVFGVELAVAESYEEKKPATDFWTFLAIDDVAPINRLISLATQQFRYQPIITYAQALAASGVFKIAGHRCKLDLIEPQEGLFFGLSPASVRGHIAVAKEKGLPFAAVSDNVYPTAEDRAFYEVLCGRGASTQSYPQHILDAGEWLAATARTGLTEGERVEAQQNSVDMLASCNARLKRAELVRPPRPKPLREMCEDGAKELGVNLDDPIYSARLDRELTLIAEKEFEDYFYLVADVCQWARKKMAVGPARGSSCGSLVCYLLRITTVDPIPHGLIFERFIDINRADLPDIDIDFSDQQRSMVFDYMRKVYGPERVARLGTVAMFKARSAMAEAAAALDVPRWRAEKIADALVDRSSADSRATDTLEDALNGSSAGRELLEEFPEFIIATRMEGHPRHYSQHAAGVVVADRAIEEYVAVDHRTGAAMCDKYDAEGPLNLLKIDALGLTQLSVFEDALEMAGMTMEELQAVPIDDQAAFDVLNRKEFSGIFQWNGNALQSLTGQIKVDRFDDIVAISALARPGPLATGGSGQWARRRSGGEAPAALHPLLGELTKETYGVVVYQEQVMRVVREMGGLSWEDTSLIRKAMSRRLGNEFFEQFKQRFVQGASAHGVERATAAEIWDQINTFGSWAFNKSHAVAYGYISYWCCWLKAHFPFEFAAATLTHETDPQRQIELLREMASEGYDYVPVDPELSTDVWTAGVRNGKRVLIGPLSNVKGIGPKLVNSIIGARKRGEPLPPRTEKLLKDPKTDIDSLWPVRDAIAKIMPDPLARNIVTQPTPISEARGDDVMVWAVPIKINPRNENEEVNVAKRGGQRIADGKEEFLQLRVMDDTGTVLAKVNRFNYDRAGRQIVDKGRPGKSIWALKGKMFEMDGDFRILSIKQARYIGDLDEAKS